MTYTEFDLVAPIFFFFFFKPGSGKKSEACLSDDNLLSRKKKNELSVLIKWFCEILHIPGMSQTSS